MNKFKKKVIRAYEQLTLSKIDDLGYYTGPRRIKDLIFHYRQAKPKERLEYLKSFRIVLNDMKKNMRFEYVSTKENEEKTVNPLEE